MLVPRSLLLTIPLVIAACGTSGPSSTNYPTEYESAFCATAVKCGEFADVSGCQMGFDASGWFDALSAELKDGTISVDANAASKCLDDLRTFSCDDDNPVGSAALSIDCGGALVGTVASGGACYASEECASANCDTSSCLGATQCCEGTCGAAQPPAADGAACTGLCAGTDVCVPTGNGGSVCQAPFADGAACMGDETCVEGDLCATDEAGGICQKPGAVGDACTEDSCGSLLFCDATNKCAAKQAIGGACSDIAGCVGWARCDVTASMCVALAGIGDACDDDTGVYCGVGACDGASMTCKALPVCSL